MQRPSSPLVFLGGVVLLWVGVRMAVEMTGGRLFPGDERARDDKPEQIAADDPARRDWPILRSMPATIAFPTERTIGALAFVRHNAASARSILAPAALTLPDQTTNGAHPTLVQPMVAAAEPFAVAMMPEPVPGSLSAPMPVADRYTLSAWAFIRPASGPTPLGQGLLGGSQVGMRAAWRIDRTGRAELHGRLVTSGRLGDGAEGALGISVQPLRAVPVRLSVERRAPIVGSGGRSAFAAFASGGVDDVPMPLRLRLDGYGAAGVVGLRQRDLFAEGAVRVRRPVARLGPVAVDAGFGVWGAIQPDLERIDVGPAVTARWQAGALSPRLSIDWRQRVAGAAAPQSGIAVTLAADF